MSFTSLAFLLFLPVVYAAYWLAPTRRGQNLILLAASLFFYGAWDWRFLGLIVGSAVVDYLVGARLALEAGQRRRKQLLALSLLFNVGALALFKYFDFFTDSLAELASAVGIELSLPTLHLILPLGISFYTFQTLSYTIDIYRRRLQPVKDPVVFGAYVTFFPQLVAGPIERASHLLAQFESERRFDVQLAKDGARQALWGFFKKMVVADNAARVVDIAYSQPESASSWLLVYATVLFAIQIYCDFSGYSDIAIGIARFFGFELCRNFRFPYFARSIPEFWKRWHISLTSWFRDYVYLPLGGSRVTRGKWIRNVWIVFLVSGFWHGANWTFLAWGALHAAFFFLLSGPSSYPSEPRLRDAFGIVSTLIIVCIAWVFFRANSVSDAFHILQSLTRLPFESFVAPPLLPFATASVVFVTEWIHRTKEHGLDIAKHPTWFRWASYYALVVAILLFAPTGGASFIYFQF